MSANATLVLHGKCLGIPCPKPRQWWVFWISEKANNKGTLRAPLFSENEGKIFHLHVFPFNLKRVNLKYDSSVDENSNKLYIKSFVLQKEILIQIHLK